MTRGTLTRGIALGVAHLLLVSSLGAKLYYDRATRPRVWVETTPYDPDLPIRGRYVSLRLRVDAPGIEVPTEAPAAAFGFSTGPTVTLSVEGDRLVARPAGGEDQDDEPSVRFVPLGGSPVPVLRQPVAFFIPEHVEDPSRRPPGETLWVEVTLPRKGPPRPIRLGVRRGEGLVEPLPLD